MQLKRLEAYGFKSFADKVDLEFDKGITAVVGPNGSGKSNITDAIRWALGEQNARNLRTRSAEDVIFTGSAARKPLSVAEVSLTFDNTGGEFLTGAEQPGDETAASQDDNAAQEQEPPKDFRRVNLATQFREVVVTRRLFRSGESEFYINMARCRLKDIYDLFADTGIGHSGMSIIGQNRIDAILNSKPEDRRVFFEEAAGITKYKSRKKESLRKLDDTQNNWLRVNDILQEIESHLTPLSQSAEKTLRHNKLNAEWQKCRLTDLSARYNRLSEENAANEKVLTAARDEALSVESESNSASARHEELMKAVVELEQTHRETTAQIDELRDKNEEAANETATLAEREKQSGQIKEGILSRRRSMTARLAAEAAIIGKIAGEKASLDKEFAGIKQQIADEQRTADELAARLGDLQNEQNAAAERQNELGRTLSEKEREFALIEQAIQNGAADRDERQKELAKNREQEEKLAAELAEYKRQFEQATKEKREIEEEKARIAAEADKIRAELDETSRRENKHRQTGNECKSKLQFLIRLQESYEGFGKATKTVLKAAEPWRTNIVGAVAEIVDVPGEYVTAVEVALGGNMQNIVAQDAATAKAAINFLKVNKAGRVTFLPLDTLVTRGSGENPQGAAGFVGRADSLVKIDEQYRKVAEFLLGRTFVFDNLDNALAAARAHGQRLRIVTLGGELINPGGSLTGGSQKSKETSFLGREEEIENLRRAVETAAKAEGEEREKRLAAAEKLRESEAQAAAVAQKLQEAMLRQTEIKTVGKETGERLTEQKILVQQKMAQNEQFAQKAAQLTEQREQTTRAMQLLQEGIASLTITQQETATSISATQNALNVAADNLRQSEMVRVRLEEKVAGSAENLREHRQIREAEEENLRQSEREEKELAESLEQARKRLEELERETEKRKQELANLSAQREQIYAERLKKMNEAQEIEKAARRAAGKLNEAQAKVHKLELAAARFKFGLEECAETLLKEFGYTPERAAQESLDLPPEEVHKRANELKKELDELGVVNPNAPAEFAEQKERHEFMSKQAADLQEARDELLKLIDEMNETMTRQFAEAFKKIQEYFNEIFVRLFGGGNAALLLTNEADILNTGVDITVQLPQKKRQSLAALSGGERALTVIALLFSFLKYKPSPFSVLDEIDAPLDEANVLRFGSFLKEFSANTQFIVVTHRKGTMEAADTMYGVTVEDAGVSKVISVKFGEVNL